MKIDRQSVFDKFDGHCAYCGCSLTTKRLNVDHIIPKYLGGTDETDNLYPSCQSCNNYKATLNIEQLRKAILHAVDVQRKKPMFKLLERYGIIKQVKTELKFHFELSEGE